MLKVIGVFNIRKIGRVIAAEFVEEPGMVFPIKIGDSLTDGTNTWKITDIDRFRRGCFGYSPLKGGLKLEGEPDPEEGVILTKYGGKDIQRDND